MLTDFPDGCPLVAAADADGLVVVDFGVGSAVGDSAADAGCIGPELAAAGIATRDKLGLWLAQLDISSASNKMNAEIRGRISPSPPGT